MGQSDHGIYQRFAVYFVPRAQTPLARFGCDWLGVDLETGEVNPAPSLFVESPRKYGFHGTLKAPMRLKPDVTVGAFVDAVEDLASRLSPVTLSPLALKSLNGFLALVPQEPQTGKVKELAWNCVTELDSFRAELTPAEREKRKNLTAAQQDNLEKWGYPFVAEEFRFHLTLTSMLGSDDLGKAEASLTPAVKNIQSEPVVLDALSIVGDPGNSNTFRLLRRFDLTGKT